MTCEYRITKIRTNRHPDLRELVEIFRDDDSMWTEWEPSTKEVRESLKDGVDLGGLRGIRGIVEATCREQEAQGAKGIRVEVREVGPWARVPR